MFICNFPGYGHISPVTTLGRLITIIYSIIGIPIFLILLADFGKVFTRIIKYLWVYVRRVYYTGSCRKVRKTAHAQVCKIKRVCVCDLSIEPTLNCAINLYF